jgi:hypothetical protein
MYEDSIVSVRVKWWALVKMIIDLWARLFGIAEQQSDFYCPSARSYSSTGFWI